MESKKAQGLSITAIILIILGIIVLVMLIIGFTAGWGNIKDWIAPSNNVQQIVSHCSVACAAGNKYDFCFKKRDLKTEEDKVEDTTCYMLATTSAYAKYGIERCPGIPCSQKTEAEEKTCNDVSGIWLESCDGDTPSIYPEEADLSDAADNVGKHCCIA